MTVAEALHETTQLLSRTGIESAFLEARLLLQRATGQSAVWIYQNPRWALDQPVLERLNQCIAQRRDGEPMAYVLGEREFYGRRFVVDRRVLVPRPETELLVDLAIDFVKKLDQPTIVDVGTGSGALAVSLAVELERLASNGRIIGTDISTEALAVARANAVAHSVEKRIQWVQSDLLGRCAGPVDVIVANLPYIPTSVIPRLQIEVRHEPWIALDGGPDGLDLYRRLFLEAPQVLRHGGGIFLEIGADQGTMVEGLAHAAFPRHTTQVHLDLAGHDRAVSIVPSLEN